MKRCSRCGLTKSLDSFSRNRRRPDGFDSHCRECVGERMRAKKARHLTQQKCTDCGLPIGDSPSKWRCQRCRIGPTIGTWGSRNMRAAVLRAYGGENPACACCGEQGSHFLTLDHVNNGGRAHRRLKGNQGVYHELRRAGFPPGFRILCFNCNIARGLYGTCPHQPEPALESTAAASQSVPVSGLEARRCTRCRQTLPYAAFYPDRGTRVGLQSRCRVCTQEASSARLNAARSDALMHYSAGAMCCACCAEREVKFLALDHIGGEGPGCLA
jgi:hypothetical protein